MLHTIREHFQMKSHKFTTIKMGKNTFCKIKTRAVLRLVWPSPVLDGAAIQWITMATM